TRSKRDWSSDVCSSDLPHQVVELPPIQPVVTEYRCHRLVCACCGTSTCAVLPAEAAARTGPRLQGVLAFFSGVCRLSKRLVQTRSEERRVGKESGCARV